MSWIVVTANPQNIRKARKRLRRQGYEAYLPAVCVRRVVAKGRTVKRYRVIKPLMSYIMVKTKQPEFVNVDLLAIIATKDVRGYLKSGDGPALVRDGVIAELRDDISKARLAAEALRHKRRLRAGMKARVSSGALAGKVGSVAWIRGKKAGLEAKLLGSMRVVEVEVGQLEVAA